MASLFFFPFLNDDTVVWTVLSFDLIPTQSSGAERALFYFKHINSIKIFCKINHLK